MKLKKIIAGSVFLAVAGGIAWLVTADVPVRQESVSKTVPNDRFFNQGGQTGQDGQP